MIASALRQLDIPVAEEPAPQSLLLLREHIGRLLFAGIELFPFL